MYSVLLTLFNNTNDDTKDAMDEAFAVYLPCAAIESPYCIYGNPQDPQRIDTLNHISTVTPLYLNERAYEDYDVRHTIASAWWEIRNKIGDNQFDQDLIDRVKFDVDGTNSMRYKPRYFYNILMRKSTHATQLIIDKAYSDRGLHFTPKVVSAGISNPPQGQDKNLFRIGDPVHVKVTNCPQNTPLTVYVVEEQDYIDGMNVSALNNVVSQISGPGVHSDNDGVWYSSTPVMTASTVGDYDILVDIGNNGVLHFAYNGANIRDGFDGLDGPGFTVFDDRIDIAISLDQSGSFILRMFVFIWTHPSPNTELFSVWGGESGGMNFLTATHTRDESRAYCPAPVKTGFPCGVGFRFCVVVPPTRGSLDPRSNHPTTKQVARRGP